MKQVATSPNRNDGWALLGNKNRDTPTKISALATVLATDGHYEVVSTPTEYWLRLAEFSSPHPLQTPRLRAVANKSNPRAIAISAAVAEFEHSKYGKQFYGNHPSLSMEAIRRVLENPDLKSPSPSGWHRLAQCVFHAPNQKLTEVLLDHVLPRVFEWHSSAIVNVYVHDPAIEIRYSLLRNARVCASFDALEFEPDVPESLSKWQLEFAPALFDKLLEWSSVLLFPHVTGMLLGTLGLSVAVVCDGIGIYEPPAIPVSLLDLKHGKSQFGQEEAGLTIEDGKVSVRESAYHGRYCWDGDYDQAESLTSFIAERASRLLRCQSDLTLFERVENRTLEVDLVLAQEQAWTIGRIIRRTLSVQSCESRWLNRLAVFEVADQWGELMREWSGAYSTKYFKLLMHPNEGAKLVKDCFVVMPEPWKSRFEKQCDKVYRDIQTIVKASVWAKRKLSSGGVNIGSDVAPQMESMPDFVANVMRDLRNTHHGYLPDEVKSKNTRPRFVLTTGEWPAAMSFLPSLWLLAFLCDPKKFLGWPARANAW